jgi:NADPH:quinone reductase-like Zn-dependent oxidoreductase
MKALQINATGSLDELTLRDVPEPSAGPSDVRIRVEAAGVNPSDVGIVLGRFPQLVLPRTLGRDFSGTVLDGPPELVGKAVWGTGGGELGLTRDGAHAEMLVVPASAVALRPPHLSAAGAAAIGTPFLTAWSALVDLGGLKPGEWAIVSGAAGAVGTASVQVAKVIGARCVAFVRSSDDVSELEQIGVDAIVRSDREDLSARVKELTGGSGAGAATNAVGAPVFAPLVDALGKGGRMVIFSAAGGRDVQFDLFAFYRKHLAFYGLDTAAFPLEHVGEVLSRLSPYFESGKLGEPAVAGRYPLDKAREAYERVRAGERGKVVILP